MSPVHRLAWELGSGWMSESESKRTVSVWGAMWERVSVLEQELAQARASG